MSRRRSAWRVSARPQSRRASYENEGDRTEQDPPRYALVDSLDKDVPTHALTDADKIHEWLQKHPDDIAALPETEKKRLIRKALDRTWIRDKDLEAVEMVCNRVTDAAEMMRIQHEIVPLVNKMNFDAIGQLLECQPPFRCGFAQAVHRGVALGIGGSNVHQAAL